MLCVNDGSVTRGFVGWTYLDEQSLSFGSRHRDLPGLHGGSGSQCVCRAARQLSFRNAAVLDGMMNRTAVANREKPAVLSAGGGDRTVGLFGRACSRLATAPTCSTHCGYRSIYHGIGTERREIEAPGFGAKLFVSCPLVLHIPLGYSRTRRV